MKKMTNREAAAYLAALIDGEGCVWMGQLKKGPSAGETRRTVVIGMTDRPLIDLAAELLTQLGIGYARSDRKPAGLRRHVWSISVQARADLIRLADLVPIQHQQKREKLTAILASYKTSKVYARRSDHKSPVGRAEA